MILVDSIFDNLILPIISREYQAYRIQRNFESAREMLASQSDIECGKGLSIIRRLCQDNPINLQEYIDLLCGFVREKTGRQQSSLGAWKDLVRSAMILICSLPRYDRNNWSYNLDLTNLRLTDIALQRLNLENAVLYDSIFHNVDFGRSSFKNCDLGGCIFEASSSVEWCDFEGSLMNRSFLSGSTTSFFKTRLWGCSLEKAKIDCCRVEVIDGFDLGPALNRHDGRIEVVSNQPQAA